MQEKRAAETAPPSHPLYCRQRPPLPPCAVPSAKSSERTPGPTNVMALVIDGSIGCSLECAGP
jgi:hypothetical protein